MATVKDIYLADKLIGHFPGWSTPEAETDYAWFNAPLEIGGVAEAGLVLHGGCFAHRPDCHVTLELRIGRTPGRHCVPIERLDWRSLEGGHSNRRTPRPARLPARVSETHLHDFWLNWSDAEQRMRNGGLVFASEVDESIQSFEEVRAYVGKRLKINNIEVVSRPDWVYDLFGAGVFSGG